MSIRVECEECGKKYSFGDNFAGRMVPCKECGEDIEVPGRAGAGRPKKLRRSAAGRDESRERRDGRRSRDEGRRGGRAGVRDRDEHDDLFDEDASSSKSTMIGLAIGGGVLLLVIVVGLIFAMSGDDPQN